MSPAAFVSKSPAGWTNCHSGKTRPLIVSEPQLCLWHSRHRNGCLEGHYRICERQSLPRVPGWQGCQESNHHSCPVRSKHQQVHKQSLQLLDRHCKSLLLKSSLITNCCWAPTRNAMAKIWVPPSSIWSISKATEEWSESEWERVEPEYHTIETCLLDHMQTH